MNLVFTLSMPGRNSWNGRWSGEEKMYAVVKKFTTKAGKAKAAELLAAGYFSHNFGDGWRAGVTITEATAQQVRHVRKVSKGFCGYEWMVENFIAYGSTEKPQAIAAECAQEGGVR